MVNLEIKDYTIEEMKDGKGQVAYNVLRCINKEMLNAQYPAHIVEVTGRVMAKIEELLDIHEATNDYPEGRVEDDECSIALAVIRTIRNMALGPVGFDASTSVALSHAHCLVYELCEEGEES